MRCAVKDLIGYDAALERLLAQATELGVECVRLAQADGRVLAEPVVAVRSRPARPLAAMDGFAVRQVDRSAWAAGLSVVGASFPGAPFGGVLGGGEAVRITTGAAMPAGSDCVLVDEAVEASSHGVRLLGAAGARPHVRATGSDFLAGEALLPAGTRLSVANLMVAAAAEALEVGVRCRPRVCIIVTGDELSCVGRGDGPDATPDSVSIGVNALVSTWGGEVVRCVACGDGDGELDAVLAERLGHSDVIVIVGGASGSERDRARAAMNAAGAKSLFEGVSIKPGKPVWAAQLGDRLLIGLPGNPAAALVTARLFLAPLIARLAWGSPASALRWTVGPVLAPIGPGGDRDTFLKAAATPSGLRILSDQDSAGHGGLAELDTLVRRRIGCPGGETGAEVECLAL